MCVRMIDREKLSLGHDDTAEPTLTHTCSTLSQSLSLSLSLPISLS